MELQRVFCGGGGKTTLWVTLMLLHLAISHGQSLPGVKPNCAGRCVPLQQCPQLSNLLDNPTIENNNILTAAICSVKNKQPLVCCPLLPLDCGQPIQHRTVLGGDHTGLDLHPWMALLGYKDNNDGVGRVRFRCAGSVINERYILTSGHCVNSLNSQRLEVVRLGEWDLTSLVDCVRVENGLEVTSYCAPPAQNYDVESTVIHPLYNTRAVFSDDIALVRLSRNIDLSHQWIQAVCLPPANYDVRVIQETLDPVVAGWGLGNQGTPHSRMVKVSVPFVDLQQCNNTYGGRLVNEQICLGGHSCTGEGGGPVVVSGPHGPPFLQIALTSYGPVNCNSANIPEVYTSISHYRDWIDQNMKP